MGYCIVDVLLNTWISHTIIHLHVTVGQKYNIVFLTAAAGYEHVDSPLPFGLCISSTPLVPRSHTTPLHYMTPSVCDRCRIISIPTVLVHALHTVHYEACNSTFEATATKFYVGYYPFCCMVL